MAAPAPLSAALTLPLAFPPPTRGPPDPSPSGTGREETRAPPGARDKGDTAPRGGRGGGAGPRSSRSGAQLRGRVPPRRSSKAALRRAPRSGSSREVSRVCTRLAASVDLCHSAACGAFCGVSHLYWGLPASQNQGWHDHGYPGEAPVHLPAPATGQGPGHSTVLQKLPPEGRRGLALGLLPQEAAQSPRARSRGPPSWGSARPPLPTPAPHAVL